MRNYDLLLLSFSIYNTNFNFMRHLQLLYNYTWTKW